MKLLPLNFKKDEFFDTLTSDIRILKDDQEIQVGSIEIDYVNFQKNENTDGMNDAERFAAWIWYEVDDYNRSFTVDALMSINWGHEEHEGLKGNIGILHKITVLPEYRKKGIGTMAMKAIMDFFQDKELDYIILQPCPFEKLNKDDYESYKTRLTMFYRTQGFNYYIPFDREVKNPYMYLQLKTA